MLPGPAPPKRGTGCAVPTPVMEADPQPTVAIVEDDPDTLETLEFLLRDRGLRVRACPPRQDVQRYLYLADIRPELIIQDVRMGALDGIELFRHLRADPATRTVPVIFFTATEQRVMSRLPDYTQMGASFVGKPNLRQLCERIDHLLQR